MNRIRCAVAFALLAMGVHAGAGAADVKPAAPSTAAPPSCEDKAVDKNGKKLAGAAKSAFLKKCEADSKPASSSCEEKAVDKNGKKLAGAARTSFLKKCEADAKPVK